MRFVRGAERGRGDGSGAEVRRQAKMYGRWQRLFSITTPYSEVRLDSSYKEEILEPFAGMLIKVHPKPTLLDIGAGLGEASRHLESVGVDHAIRLDINQDALSHQPKAVLAPAWRLPFKNGAFTGIHMKDAITHIPPKFRRSLFSEMRRVLVPGGEALIVGKESGILADPGQYSVSPKKLIAQSAEHGLSRKILTEWSPRSRLGDWYTGADPKRFVLLLKNATPPTEENITSDIVNQ